MAANLVSVIMTVYNGEQYLAEAADSILRQSFADFEFIIIDDGSTDSTPQILADYAKRDPRVRAISHPNMGRPESLNRGIEHSTAPLIARMDADDIAFPHRLEQQVQFLNAHSEIGLLGGAVDIVTPDGRRISTYQPPTGDAALRAALRFYNPFRHPTLIMRRETLLATGGYRTALADADDYDLILRMAERTQLANVHQPILSYRVHPSQASVFNIAHQMLCGAAARAAASFRERNLPDPLLSVEEITPEIVRQLGVCDEEIRRDTAAAYVNWIGLLAEPYPDSALKLVEDLLRFAIRAPSNDPLWLQACLELRAFMYGNDDSRKLWLRRAVALSCSPLKLAGTSSGRSLAASARQPEIDYAIESRASGYVRLRGRRCLSRRVPPARWTSRHWCGFQNVRLL